MILFSLCLTQERILIPTNVCLVQEILLELLPNFNRKIRKWLIAQLSPILQYHGSGLRRIFP